LEGREIIMPTFKGIVALAKNRVIGKDNKLPWHFKEDLKFFKKTTWEGNVIMGRKTWEGMPCHWLDRRTIWVMTKKNTYGWLQTFYERLETRYMVNMVEDTSLLPEGEYWICGGLEIYNLFLPKISEFYVTYLNQDYEGDAVMPAFEDSFEKEESVLKTEHFEIKKLYARKPRPEVLQASP
jgi:dihydrofolate reductase